MPKASRSAPAKRSNPSPTHALLTDEEYSELEKDWQAARRDYPRQAGIPDLFEAQVLRSPGAAAVEQGSQRLTYRQLDLRANQLAHRLRELGAGPENICGICMPRSIDMVVAILGVLKAGAAYLPLDPGYPVDRLDLMLREAAPTVLLSKAGLAGTLTARLPTLDVSTVLLDSGAPLIDCQPEVPPRRPELAEELAYVMYTSGSTGRPKGVMVEHRAVVNQLLALRRDYGFGEADTVLQLPSLAFNPSARDILGPLTAGARLVLLDESSASDPRAILGALVRHQVNCLLSLLPGMGRSLLAEPGAGSLRLVLTCGEVLPSEEARALRERFGCEVANQFGPTECVMAASKHTLGADDENRSTVLAGRAEANARLYVLDAERRLLPSGQPGELYVGGESLARGYLGRPELTAERFLPDLFSDAPGARMYRTGDMVRRLPDGNLEFLGRFDDRVRVGGAQVELGEVEASLAAHPAVREVAVAVREEKLAAYFVARRSPGPAAGELRAFLRQGLPEHMVPSLYVQLEDLPRTPSGKLDRHSLPHPSSYSGAKSPARRRGAPASKTKGTVSLPAALGRVLARKRAAVLAAVFGRLRAGAAGPTRGD